MQPVKIIQATAVPLPRADVDTDQIIPSDWLKRVERTGFEKGLFAEWRDDRDFVLNDERYAGARILLAGPNFGTGSSREHAVWALQQYGFAAVVSPRFGDIFRNNSVKCGLLPARVSPDFSAQLMDAVAADPQLELVIDVAQKTIEAPAAGLAGNFELDDNSAMRLLEGLDDISMTLRADSAIGRYEKDRRATLPALSALSARGSVG